MTTPSLRGDASRYDITPREKRLDYLHRAVGGFGVYIPTAVAVTSDFFRFWAPDRACGVPRGVGGCRALVWSAANLKSCTTTNHPTARVRGVIFDHCQLFVFGFHVHII